MRLTIPRHIWAVGLALAPAVTSPARAQTETFGVLTYTIPAGFQRDPARTTYAGLVRQEGGKVLCVFAVYAAFPGVGDAEANFKAEWKDLMQRDVAPRNAMSSSAAGDGWTRTTGVEPSASLPTGERMRITVATWSGHGQRASVRLDELAPSCRAAATGFLESIRPAAAPSAVVAAPSGGKVIGEAAGIVGVWRGYGNRREMSSSTNASGTGWGELSISDRLTVIHIAFLADGTFWYSVHDDGLLDAQAHRQQNPASFGTFAVQGGQGRVAFGGGSVAPFQLEGDALIFDRTRFKRQPANDGFRLAATYSAERDPARFSGVVRAEPTITFTADGRFADRGALYWVRHYRDNLSDNLAANYGQGTYDIRSNTITFKYDDGRVIRYLFLDVEDGRSASPKQIGLGNRAWLDRK